MFTQYRDYWIAQGIDQYIGFYNREFYCFDNFSSFKINYNGNLYTSVEEAYQAQKFIKTAPEIAAKIKDSMSAYEAKLIAHNNPELVARDWENIKVQVMEDLLRAKVSQHHYVKEKLLETGYHRLVEDSPTDSFWGIGQNRDGKNMLGKLWMKIRSDLQMEADSENVLKETVIMNWEHIKEQLKTSCRLSDVSYKTWIEPLKILQINEESILISGQEESIGRKYIEKHYLEKLKEIVASEACRVYEIQLMHEDNNKIGENEEHHNVKTENGNF